MDIAGVSFIGRVVVFGGLTSGRQKMYEFSEEGELLKDLSKDALTPTKMSKETYVVHRDKIYAFDYEGKE